MKLTLLFCEGPHDVAFIYRLLRYDKYSVFSKKLTELPPLFKNCFVSLLTNQSFYENSNLTQRPVLPTLLVKNKDTKKEVWVALYALEGNRQPVLVQSLIQDYQDFVLDAMTEEENLNISIAFINDADTGGVDKELNELKENYGSEPIIIFNSLLSENNPVCEIRPHLEGNVFTRQGYYIFCNQERKGKLEDIVLSLMQQENEPIFEAVDIFLDTPIGSHKRDKKYDLQKSKIGSAGQLLKSGKTNTVVIQDAFYINEQKVRNNPKCQEIIAFINEMTNI